MSFFSHLGASWGSRSLRADSFGSPEENKGLSKLLTEFNNRAFNRTIYLFFSRHVLFIFIYLFISLKDKNKTYLSAKRIYKQLGNFLSEFRALDCPVRSFYIRETTRILGSGSNDIHPRQRNPRERKKRKCHRARVERENLERSRRPDDAAISRLRHTGETR